MNTNLISIDEIREGAVVLNTQTKQGCCDGESLPAPTAVATNISTCCSAEKQAVCCEPSDKEACCGSGSGSDSSCGCQ